MQRFLLSVLLLCLIGPGTISAQGGGSTSGGATGTPETVVRGFYKWYLNSLNNNNFTPLRQRTTALKYLTPQLLTRAPRLTKQMNADIFICAQDFDSAWERNISLAETRVQGARASTVVTLRGSEVGNSSIKVVLRKLPAGWRIDSVECVFDD